MADGKLEEVIDKAWASVRDRVESKRDLDFDHEFTLQFHLAWEVARLFNFSENLNVRFEFPCGKDADGETIRLDLLLRTDPEAKVAVELKAPVRSETGKNSAMTQFRMRFYRDIHPTFRTSFRVSRRIIPWSEGQGSRGVRSLVALVA